MLNCFDIKHHYDLKRKHALTFSSTFWLCVCVIDWQIRSVFIKKQAGTRSEEQRFLSSDDTTRVCQLDKYKRTIQSSRNKGWCTSPSQAIWSVVAASLTAAVRWSTFDRPGLCLLTYIRSQPQTSNHTSHSYLSVHLNLRNIYTYSLFLCVSVAWLRVLPQWPGTDVRAAVCLFSSQKDAQQSQVSHKENHSLHLCISE